MSDTRNPEVSSAPIFQAFSWYNAGVPCSHANTFFEHTHDISNGISTLLSLIEFSEIEADDDRPVLSQTDKGTLMRLAITASRMLATEAEQQIDSANKAYPQQ